MKKIKNGLAALSVLCLIIVATGYSSGPVKSEKVGCSPIKSQNINLFVSHGHCSLPFSGRLENLIMDGINPQKPGNPLEDLSLSFEINPNTFKACSADEYTAHVKTPGLFINEENENMKFKSTSIYTMGIDWYQINGTLSIKGVERPVKLFASGIRNPSETMSSYLVIEGQLNLEDWGIDYEKIVHDRVEERATKWMHLNAKINLEEMAF